MSPSVTPASSGPDVEPNSQPIRQQGAELTLTLKPKPGEDLPALFARMADALAGATIVNLLVFGQASASACAAAATAMQRTFGKVEWPVTWVEGGACDGGRIAGLQVTALDGLAVQGLRFEGRVVGSVFQDGGARHCLLGGLGPRERSASRADQTTQTLERLERVLAQAGFAFADIVRTWFFLEDILSWYDEFNRARTAVYSGVKFRTGSHPASTGVGARNAAGAALALAVRAMQPLSASVIAREAASPLQCPAPAYGSSFSRAMEISTTAGRRLFISGTASIAPGGATLWQNIVGKQVDLTMQVVGAILQSRGYSFADLTRAVAYFKHPGDAPAFTGWCAAHGLSAMPVVPTHCAICRDDLLFELEADAGKPV